MMKGYNEYCHSQLIEKNEIIIVYIQTDC